MRITRVFLDTYMGYGFQGLALIAKNAKTKLEDTTVVFINRRQTAFKLLVNGSYLTYFKNNDKKIPIEALRHLPEVFGGSRIEFDEAVRKVLEKQGINGGHP